VNGLQEWKVEIRQSPVTVQSVNPLKKPRCPPIIPDFVNFSKGDREIGNSRKSLLNI
jgi:hypothetical protein